MKKLLSILLCLGLCLSFAVAEEYLSANDLEPASVKSVYKIDDVFSTLSQIAISEQNIIKEYLNNIKKVIDINLTNPSTPINNRKCSEFGYYYDLIWKEIDHYEL